MERKLMTGKSGKSVCRLAALLVVLGGLLLPRVASALDWTIGNTTVNLGGFVQLDTIYSRFSDGPVLQSVARDFYLPGATPIFPAGADAHTYLDFSAKQTRLWFGTNTDFGEHKIGSWVEIDFISGQIPQTVLTSPTTTATTGNKVNVNAYNPALRRAYLTIDNQLLFGQDWSTFVNTDALPDGLDLYDPGDGAVWVLQPQIRFTYGPLQLALETPETTVYPNRDIAATPTNDNYVPDGVVRYNLDLGFASFAIAGLIRELRDHNTVANVNDTTYGYGGSVSGKITLPWKDDFRFMATGGRGIGRYVALSTLGDAVVNSTNQLNSIWLLSAFVAYRHFWTDKWRSSLIGSGITGFDIANFLGPTATRRVGSGAFNLLYSPVPQLILGAEVRVAGREDLAASSGSLIRMQASARYTF
jgi:hypothetical protein